ncbi:MAG: hypothetical protein M5U29_10195 [Anaerolineae bacterium]|nr:hypothetical protein [Anaerolineae bacterium]
MRRTNHAGVWGGLALVLGAALSACGGDAPRDTSQPTNTPVPLVMAWQPAQAVISADNPIVAVSGVLRLHQGTVNDLALSASGARLATAAADNVVGVWNLTDGGRPVLPREPARAPCVLRLWRRHADHGGSRRPGTGVVAGGHPATR